MAKRKGLFHLVEIVIITIIMFVMLAQVSYIPGTEEDWNRPRLMTAGRDILFSMEEGGIDWTDEGNVREYLAYAFNNTHIQYNLEYRNVPQDHIGVGCLCDGSFGCVSFCDWLSTMLASKSGVSFNNYSVTFSVINTTSINNLFDVMITNQGLSGLHSSVGNYLAAERGFVLVNDLDQSDFNAYGNTLRDFFAVDNASETGSGPVNFYTFEVVDQPRYYSILKYFANIPNGTGDRYNITHEFAAFSSDNTEKLVSPQGRTILRAFTRQPAVIAKYSASKNQGRAAWISESSGEDDWSVLLTSLIIWSSDHRRLVTGGDMSQSAATVSMHIIPDDTSRADYMFQPMEAVLTMGYLY